LVEDLMVYIVDGHLIFHTITIKTHIIMIFLASKT